VQGYGAEVVIADDVHHAFELARDIRDKEGRFFVHPFEGPSVALGTGTVGLEICEQVPEFDALVIPIGGGGLIAGISNAVKQLRPEVEIIGVEPEGADSMHRSFASGEPESIEKVTTIADSLSMNIAIEPACAATTAALLGPLRDSLRGKRVVLVMCGSNIDWETFSKQVVFDDAA